MTTTTTKKLENEEDDVVDDDAEDDVDNDCHHDENGDDDNDNDDGDDDDESSFKFGGQKGCVFFWVCCTQIISDSLGNDTQLRVEYSDSKDKMFSVWLPKNIQCS
jgi:hypothetical protein